jgi:hypothetical protein
MACSVCSYIAFTFVCSFSCDYACPDEQQLKFLQLVCIAPICISSLWLVND